VGLMLCGNWQNHWKIRFTSPERPQT